MADVIHPAYLYAFERCGFLVTQENQHLMSDAQLAEWEAALDDYFTEHPDSPPLG